LEVKRKGLDQENVRKIYKDGKRKEEGKAKPGGKG
jgi:hypothetical protein